MQPQRESSCHSCYSADNHMRIAIASLGAWRRMRGIREGGKATKLQAGAELHFASRRGRVRDGSELRSIHEPVRRAEVGMVHRVEDLAANLEAQSLGDGELSRERQIHGLHPGTVNGVAAGIPEGVRGGHGKCRGV